MTVNEAIGRLQKHADAGRGNLSLIAIDSASGVSYEASIGAISEVYEVDQEAGVLCDWEVGNNYASVYLD